MVKVRYLESVPFYVYVMYYVYVTSGPSLLIESTDSMIILMLGFLISHEMYRSQVMTTNAFHSDPGLSL